MLSRRNIRIKVMQVLYAISRDREITPKQASLLYDMSIRQAFELYLMNLSLIIQVAIYARHDHSIKSSKLRPSEDDKSFRPKLADNDLIKSLLDNKGLQQIFRLHKINDKFSADDTRLLYLEFAKTEDYQTYLKIKDNDAGTHQKALLALYRMFISSEQFNEMVDEKSLSWQDDKSLVVGAMKKTLKALPAVGSFYAEYEPTDETVREFGELLLDKVANADNDLLQLIEPTLKNWDAERVAVLDMILLKMAVSELMGFPTIPTKVTLNEYVEISKLYSTDKSKDFINGILDRLMKKLAKEGKIVKEGRGLLEE